MRGSSERDAESGYPSSQILWTILEYQASPVRKSGFGWGLCRLVESWNIQHKDAASPTFSNVLGSFFSIRYMTTGPLQSERMGQGRSDRDVVERPQP
jgi:hypothetical protein